MASGPSPWLSCLAVFIVSLCHGNAQDDPGCVRIDAALTDKKHYTSLFHENEYVKLSPSGVEVRKAPITEWGGLRGSIDAAVLFAGNGNTYFFKGSQYYKLSFIVVGPYKTEAWDSEFADGIDAAGNRLGKSYFFKGCTVVSIIMVGKKRQRDETFNSQTLGLPCDVDAAFSKDGELYVIKGNDVWKWGHAVEGPISLSDVLAVTSWNICPASEGMNSF